MARPCETWPMELFWSDEGSDIIGVPNIIHSQEERRYKMRALLLYLLRLTLLLSLLTSCEHRPLQDFVNAHYIRVYVDENIRNVTFGFYNEQYDRPEHERPRVIRVVLADPVSGTIISERYLQNQGVDSMGYYLDGYIGAPAGRYNMLLYNFGSPRTLIGN